MVKKIFGKEGDGLQQRTYEQVYDELLSLDGEFIRCLRDIRTSAGEAQLNHIVFMKRMIEVYKTTLDEWFKLYGIEWRGRMFLRRKNFDEEHEQKLLTG